LCVCYCIALHALTRRGRTSISTSIRDEMNREHGHSRAWRYMVLDPVVFNGVGGDEIGHRVNRLHRDARTNRADANNEYINYLNITFSLEIRTRCIYLAFCLRGK